MAPEFIFMLTRNDRTIADAEARLEDALAAGIRHIGFKDVGLPFAALARIAEKVHAAGCLLYLEVVSLEAASEAASAEAALRLGADVLMGGTRPEVVAPILCGARTKYFPFAGRVSGHPSVLEGTLEETLASALSLAERDRVDGLDLLAYRSRADGRELIARICAAVGKPIVVAGSIDRAERIAAVADCGAAAFTIGTAIFEGAFPCGPGIRDQLAYVLAEIERCGS